MKELLLRIFYRITRQPRVLASVPRYEHDRALAVLPNDTRVLFDTGTQNCYVPSNVLDECSTKSMVVGYNDLENTTVYVDGTKKIYKKSAKLMVHFAKNIKWQIEMIIEPEATAFASVLLGRSFMEKYVFNYCLDRIELLDRKPKGYDIVIPIVFKNKRPFVSLKVNGHEHEFLLDTGLRGGIELPVNDKEYAISEVKPFESTFFAGPYERKETGYEEKRGKVEIGSKSFHPAIVYTDHNNTPYIFSPAYLPVPVYIDLKGCEMGIKTK